jgi:hypothetical protein
MVKVKVRFLAVTHLVLLTLVIFLASCGGGSGGGSSSSSTAIKGLCPIAFKGADTSSEAVSAAEATPTPVGLSTCTRDSNNNVVIGSGGCGPRVYVDKPFTGNNALGSITINSDGFLVFLHDPGYELDTSGIVVNGVLGVGTSLCPVGSHNRADVATIKFTDTRAVQGVTKGITVNSGGTLQMYGATGVAPHDPPSTGNGQAPSWTYLSAPAGPPILYGAGLGVGKPVGANGATSIQVADFVDWQPSQWIVVAGTDFSPDSAEFVMISGVKCASSSAGPCTFTLDSATPLVNYHFGGPAPDIKSASSDGPNQNYGVDERAEVGLISRNVKLTSEITGSDLALGGEIHVMSGYKSVEIQGVEIEKFGKAKANSYPLNFDSAGNAASTTLVNSNSIHHGYNHCIAVNATNNLTIENNVCARIVDHLYYMVSGSESGNTFRHNLGIGAMSNSFNIAASNPGALGAFWPGDYLTQSSQSWYNGYNGFNIAYTDDASVKQANPPPPPLGIVPSGFWITNPGQNTFVGNSIAGCQDVGRGFWILPASTAAARVPLPAGAFASNRAHGCYTGFDTAADDGVVGSFLYTPQGKCVGGQGAGKLNDCDTIAEFDDLTATRNRNRGIWVRASWYNLERTHLATNRDSVSLVSSGGTEGSPPGEWGLINDPILIGISTNNPNRFGPCPYPGQNQFGGNAGCYESAVAQGNGYPDPIWNMFGFMFYDGPARVEGAKYINFNADPTPYLTSSDVGFLKYYESKNNMPCGASGSFVYEGDAAMGWFQSNLNSYPPTQYTENVTFENVDLRHQIYTQSVGASCFPPPAKGANFRDGDKFTVILDNDATLSGFEVVPAGGGSPIQNAKPISLNNIPFLAGPGTADECLSEGAQDLALENRPTSLISPYNYATLEFSAITPPCNGAPPGEGKATCQNDNVMIFTKDEIDYPNGGSGGGQIQFTDNAVTTAGGNFNIKCGGSADSSTGGVPGHACVALSGRNGNGAYEPKLANGLSYTIQANNGMPNFVSLMYGDAELPSGISSTNPFHSRVGLCYLNKGADSAPLASDFTVYKGSKAFSGPNGNLDSLEGLFTKLACSGLDNVLCGGSLGPFCFETLCPSSPFYAGSTTSPTATQLTQASSIADLDDATKCPNGTCFFYDQTSGLLFLNMVQEQPNAGGPFTSPLGSCTGSESTSDPACADENFYSCPGPGCELYTIEVAKTHYSPGQPSACTPYGAAASTDYTRPYPTGLPQLAYKSNGTVVQTQVVGATTGFPHRAPTNAPSNLCPTNAPSSPDWPPAPPSSIPSVFTIGLPANTTVSLSPNVTPITGSGATLYPLQQTTYTLTATAKSCSGQCTCAQKFTVTGNGWTSSGSNCCQLGTGGSDNSIGVAAGPYLCAGP